MFIEKMKTQLVDFTKNYLGKISANTLGAISIALMHLTSIPSLFTVLIGKSDRLPSLEFVMFVWAALTAIFLKSLIERNTFYIVLITIGFLIQTVIMSLILFK